MDFEKREREIIERLRAHAKNEQPRKTQEESAMNIDELLNMLSGGKSTVEEKSTKKNSCGGNCHLLGKEDGEFDFKEAMEFRNDMIDVFRKHNKNIGDVAIALSEQSFQKLAKNCDVQEAEVIFESCTDMARDLAEHCIEHCDSPTEGVVALLLAAKVMYEGAKEGLETIPQEEKPKAKAQPQKSAPKNNSLKNLEDLMNFMMEEIEEEPKVEPKKQTSRRTSPMEILKHMDSQQDFIEYMMTDVKDGGPTEETKEEVKDIVMLLLKKMKRK